MKTGQMIKTLTILAMTASILAILMLGVVAQDASQPTSATSEVIVPAAAPEAVDEVSPESPAVLEDLDVPFLTQEDKEAAIKLLNNRRVLESLLGPNRKFIYDPMKLKRPFRDPMVIPWSQGDVDRISRR